MGVEEERGRPDWVPDFAFAFDDPSFSDRILRIEILPDSPSGDITGEPTFPDWARNRKRRCDLVLGKEKERGLTLLLNKNEDSAIVTAHHNLDSEVDATVADLVQLGDQNAAPDVLRVRNIHISSIVLAASSPFFRKLFSNGMKESEQQEVALRIHDSEEAVFLDLLQFMYCGTLSMRFSASLLDVLMAADKFEVTSCIRECNKLLRELPMTTESALLYLKLPTSVSMGEEVQPLINAAKQFLATQCKDIDKFQEVVHKLPLGGLEAILSSDNLFVISEDVVCDLVLKWARVHYPILEDRQKILASRLHRLIRFPFMTRQKLINILAYNDFDHELQAKVVLRALLLKGEPPHKQQILAEDGANTTYRHYFVERGYMYRPVKVVEFELPHQQCIVYLDLKREELKHLIPSGRLYSQLFLLGGQEFYLLSQCNKDQHSSSHCFGLYLGAKNNGSASLSVHIEFAARQKPSDDFVSKFHFKHTFRPGNHLGRGCQNLFGIPWTSFIAGDSAYFINGILHLRAELTIRI